MRPEHSPGDRALDGAEDPLESIRRGTTWDAFCDALKEAGAAVVRPGSPSDDFDRAEGYRYLSRLTRLALEKYVEFSDPLAPEFYRLSHETAKIGIDNPDSAYLNATLSGACEYVIRGRRGSEPYLSFAVYHGHYGSGGRSGCSGYLEWDDIEADEDGRFELFLSAKEQPRNWLRLEADSHLLVVRRNHLDRANETPTELEIERRGEGDGPLPLDPASLAANLMAAARYVGGTAQLFCDWAEAWQRAPNCFLPLDDAVKEGAHGDPNFRMLTGYWDLGPEESLLVDVVPPECAYWNIELCNHWAESLDYRYHRVHINKHDAVVAPDGHVRVVVAHADPGVPNWLDTAGHVRGTLGLRWGKASLHPVPACRVVAASEVARIAAGGIS